MQLPQLTAAQSACTNSEANYSGQPAPLVGGIEPSFSVTCPLKCGTSLIACASCGFNVDCWIDCAIQKAPGAVDCILDCF